MFRTYSFDLGLYNHVIFDYSEFRLNDSLLIEPLHRQRNQLSDHFDLWLMLISPLRYIFGTYTLLIVQITSIATAGIAVNRIANHIGFAKPLSAQIHFYCIWGIYSALAFDYHSNVVASMFVPWLILAVISKRISFVVLFSLLIGICKENMALWLSFIYIGLSLLPDTSRSIRVLLRVGALISFGYFLLVVKFIMPALMPSGLEYIHLSFGQLGNGITEIVTSLITQPLQVFLLLFKSPYIHEPHTYWIKTELYVYFLFSGGLLLLLRPQFLLMLIPVFAQKLLHDDIVKWGINLHYSIEFVPILAIGSLYGIRYGISNTFKQRAAYLLLIFVSISLTLFSFTFRYSKWFDNTTIHFLHPKHYRQSFDIRKVHRILEQIPSHYAVAASNNLTPHLSFRKVIYSFPMWDKVDVIVLLKVQESYFPFDKVRYEQEIGNLKTNTAFGVRYEDDEILVFARKGVDMEIKP